MREENSDQALPLVFRFKSYFQEHKQAIIMSVNASR